MAELETIPDPADGVPAQLVVIGNGMAGARTVEEILARGWSPASSRSPCSAMSRTATTTASCSPTCCPARRTDAEIFLNTPDVVPATTTSRCTPGAGRPGSTGLPSSCYAIGHDGQRSVTPYDVLIIATGSRSFMPAIEGLRTGEAGDVGLKPGVFAFRTIDDTRGMIDYAQHEHHTRAVVIGGGLLGLEAARGLQAYGLAGGRGARRCPPDERADRPGRPARSCGQSVEKLGIEVHSKARTTAILGDGQGPRRLAARPPDASSATWWSSPPASGPNIDLAVTSGFTVERAIVVDDQMRTMDDADVYAVGECVQHRGEVYGLVAPLWEQAVVLADHITGRDLQAAYHGSRTATKLKVAGVDVASMGLQGPERDTDEHSCSPSPRRASSSPWSSGTRS